jgi:CubicO group peptidase (beta-lactamase class C family)
MPVPREQGSRDWTPDPRAVATTGIRDVLQAGIDAGRYPGAQVYASVDGNVLADVAVGERQLGAPMRPDTIVSWQCNTKPLTGAAICQLWERRQLKLDKPVAHYLPGFELNGKAAVTIRHLLTHTVRFQRESGQPLVNPTPDQVEERLRDLALAEDWPLGRQVRYNPMLAYATLGAVVRRVDGRSLSTYVRDEIFGPLGMEDCWIGVDPPQIPAVSERLAFLYNTDGEQPELPLMAGSPRGRDLDVCVPGTGGIGPMRELGRFYESLVDSLSGGPRALLKRKTVAAMLQPVDLGEHRAGPYGLGLQVVSGHYGMWFPDAFGHEGLQFSLAFADPTRRVVVAAMVNGLHRGGSLADLLKVSRAVHDALPAS